MSASEAYSVAANLMFKSNISEALPAIIESMERLEKILNSSREALDKLAGGYDAMAAAAIKAADTATRATTEGAEAGARAQTEAAEAGARAQIDAAERTARAAETSARLATQAHERGVQRRYDASYAAAQRENALRDSQADRDQAAAIRSDRSEAEYMNRDYDRASRRAAGHHISSMDLVMAAGATEAATGAAAHAIEHATMEPRYYEYMLTTDDRISPERAHQASDAAFAATRSAPGSTHGGNMEALYDLTSITGDVDEAQAALPQFARLSAVLRAANFHATGGDDPAYASAKALEILGKLQKETVDPTTGKITRSVDVDQLNHYTEAMARVDVQTGGKVGPNEYLNYARMGRIGALQMNDQFTFTQLPALLQVLGGNRTGTAINSANQVFEGGKATNKTIEAMEKYHLADAGAVEHYKDARGKDKTRIHYDKIHDTDDLQHNMVEYVKKVGAQLEAQGFSKDEIFRILQEISQRGTVGGTWGDIYANQAAIDKEADRNSHILKKTDANPDPIGKYLSDNPLAKVQQFQGAVENLLAALGGPAMDPALHALDWCTKELNGLGDWAKAHPNLAASITTVTALGAAIAGAAAAISGAMLIYGPLIAAMKGKLLSGPGVPSPSAIAASSPMIAGMSESGAQAAKGVARSLIGKGLGLLGGLGEGYAFYQATIDTYNQAKDTAQTLNPMAGGDGHFSVFNRQTWADPNSSIMWARPKGMVDPAAPRVSDLAPASKSGPQDVRVVNPGDLAKANVANLARQANRPDAGVGGFDSTGSVQSHPNTGLQ